jgi:hypothetical protein
MHAAVAHLWTDGRDSTQVTATAGCPPVTLMLLSHRCGSIAHHRVHTSAAAGSSIWPGWHLRCHAPSPSTAATDSQCTARSSAGGCSANRATWRLLGEIRRRDRSGCWDDWLSGAQAPSGKCTVPWLRCPRRAKRRQPSRRGAGAGAMARCTCPLKGGSWSPDSLRMSCCVTGVTGVCDWCDWCV